jgi:hypothetical protein
MFKIHFKTLLSAVCVLWWGIAMATNQDCLEPRLAELRANYTNLPEIKYAPGTAWFNENMKALTPPPHDYAITRTDNANIVTGYYFDLKAGKGYLQRRGGYVDSVGWYGPFTVDEQFASCLRATIEADKQRAKEEAERIKQRIADQQRRNIDTSSPKP